MYLVSWTRPDIAFSVSQCSRFMLNPCPLHIVAAKRILRYLKGTKELGLVYSRGTKAPNQLYGYADADHTGDPEGRRSITGYMVMLNGATISWQLTCQSITALSSAEAEYYAASAISCNLVYLRSLMENLR